MASNPRAICTWVKRSSRRWRPANPMSRSAAGDARISLDRAFAAQGPVVINVHTDPEAGAAIKTDPLLRMILFSDLAEGQRSLR